VRECHPSASGPGQSQDQSQKSFRARPEFAHHRFAARSDEVTEDERDDDRIVELPGQENGLYFPFIRVGRSYGKQGTYQLVYSATFAVLAAFRNFVIEGEDGKYEWKGGFEVVTRAWRELGGELVITCQDHAEQRWRRRESNPRPQSPRTEPLQA
jgi:hypothetical protein